MSTFYSIIGQPLDRIVHFLGEKEYSRLYASGDVVVRKRIKKSPMVCHWRPLSYAEHVEEIEFMNCNFSYLSEQLKFSFYGAKFCRQVQLFHIPYTVRKIKVSCSSESWDKLSEMLPNVTDLALIIAGGKLNDEIPLPVNLTSFSYSSSNPALRSVLPLSLTSLTIECKIPGVRYDFSYLVNLKTFTSTSACDTKLPPSLTSIMAPHFHIDGNDFPHLKVVSSESVKGILDNALIINVKWGDFSGTRAGVKVITKEDCKYENGILYISAMWDIPNIITVSKHVKICCITSGNRFFRDIARSLCKAFPLVEKIIVVHIPPSEDIIFEGDSLEELKK